MTACVWRDLFDGGGQLVAVHAGHRLVGDDEVEPSLVDPFQRIGALLGQLDVVAIALERCGEERADRLLIIDNKHAGMDGRSGGLTSSAGVGKFSGRLSLTGSEITNVVPRPGALWISSVPRCR